MIRSKLHLINAAHVFIIVGLTSQENVAEGDATKRMGKRADAPTEQLEGGGDEQIIVMYFLGHPTHRSIGVNFEH